MGRVYSTRDKHPKYDHELYRRPLIAHIMQGEDVRRKTQLLKLLNIYKVKMGEYDEYVNKTEQLREREHGRS